MIKLHYFIGIAALATLSLTTASQAAVVYQSNFTTGTTLADADLASAGSSGSWADAGNRAEFTGTGGNARASLYTTASFTSAGGFTLEVTFLQTNQIPSNFSVGLVNANIPGLGSNDWLNKAMPGAYGIGFSSAGGQAGDLATNDGSTIKNNFTSNVTLSSAQGNTVALIEQTVLMTVTATDWSYSLNGAIASSGTFATAFDLSQSYQFVSFLQINGNNRPANESDGSYFSNITVTAIPEPGTYALLAGMTGLVYVMLRRRR